MAAPAVFCHRVARMGNTGSRQRRESSLMSGEFILPLVAGLAVAIAVAGCVTMTSPVPAGKDTYMRGLGAGGGFSSDADLLARTV